MITIQHSPFFLVVAWILPTYRFLFPFVVVAVLSRCLLPQSNISLSLGFLLTILVELINAIYTYCVGGVVLVFMMLRSFLGLLRKPCSRHEYIFETTGKDTCARTRQPSNACHTSCSNPFSCTVFCGRVNDGESAQKLIREHGSHVNYQINRQI